MGDQRYQFRLLTHVSVPKSDGDDSIALHLNNQYDSCRMFTNDFEIVEDREMILKRARAFANEQTEMFSAVSISVPNEFGTMRFSRRLLQYQVSNVPNYKNGFDGSQGRSESRQWPRRVSI